MCHEQILVKVNAQVDRGIAPLVEAVNSIPCVFTVSSCEGDDRKDAYVAFFITGDDWHAVGELIDRLSLELGKDKTVNDISFTFSIEWYGGGGTPTGYLRVPRRHITALSKSVQSAAHRLAQLLPTP